MHDSRFAILSPVPPFVWVTESNLACHPANNRAVQTHEGFRRASDRTLLRHKQGPNS